MGGNDESGHTVKAPRNQEKGRSLACAASSQVSLLGHMMTRRKVYERNGIQLSHD